MKISTPWCLNPTSTPFSLNKFSRKQNKKKKKKPLKEKMKRNGFSLDFSPFIFSFQIWVDLTILIYIRKWPNTLDCHKNLRHTPLSCNAFAFVCDIWQPLIVTYGASSTFNYFTKILFSLIKIQTYGKMNILFHLNLGCYKRL